MDRCDGKAGAGLAETLRGLQSTIQERWFSRLFLLKPLVVGTLALFWIATGLVTVIRLDAAAAILSDRGHDGSLAWAVALGGAMLDLALGAGILFWPMVR